MRLMTFRFRSRKLVRRALLSICCVSLLVARARTVRAQETPQATDSAAVKDTLKLPPEQLDALVAPIALYPDPLLAQTLVASTYPLEIVQLQQWLAKHPELKDKALADSVAKQPWDPSIQSMAALPDVVKRLADDIQWTTDLGNAFLAQQSDVMDAVQRMRKKAKDNGALESNEQQKVETKVVEQKTGDRRGAGEPRGRLRAVVQPDGRLRRRRTTTRTRRSTTRPIRTPGARSFVARHVSVRRGMGRRALPSGGWGCGMRLGAQRHQRQCQQQFQPQQHQ